MASTGLHVASGTVAVGSGATQLGIGVARSATGLGVGVARAATGFSLGLVSALTHGPAAALEALGPNVAARAFRRAGDAVDRAHGSTSSALNSAWERADSSLRRACEASVGSMRAARDSLNETASQDWLSLRICGRLWGRALLGPGAFEAVLTTVELVRSFSGPLAAISLTELRAVALAWAAVQGAVVEAGPPADRLEVALPEDCERWMRYTAAVFGGYRAGVLFDDPGAAGREQAAARRSAKAAANGSPLAEEAEEAMLDEVADDLASVFDDAESEGDDDLEADGALALAAESPSSQPSTQEAGGTPAEERPPSPSAPQQEPSREELIAAGVSPGLTRAERRQASKALKAADREAKRAANAGRKEQLRANREAMRKEMGRKKELALAERARRREQLRAAFAQLKTPAGRGSAALTCAGLSPEGVEVVLFELGKRPAPGEPHVPGRMVAIDRVAGCVVVALRGSSGLRDILLDLDCQPEVVEWGGRAGLAHGGMLRSALHLDEGLAKVARAALERLPPGQRRILMCGHSLGGGVAALLAKLWLDSGRPPLAAEVQCLAFGCPQVLDADSAEVARRHTTSFVQGPDMVPRLSLATSTDLREVLVRLHDPAAHSLDPDLQAESLLAAAESGEAERLMGAHASLRHAVGFSPGRLYPSGRIIQLSAGLAPYEVDRAAVEEMIICSDMLRSHLPRHYLLRTREEAARDSGSGASLWEAGAATSSL